MIARTPSLSGVDDAVAPLAAQHLECFDDHKRKSGGTDRKIIVRLRLFRSRMNYKLRN